jgi:hypothetical protein
MRAESSRRRLTATRFNGSPSPQALVACCQNGLRSPPGAVSRLGYRGVGRRSEGPRAMAETVRPAQLKVRRLGRKFCHVVVTSRIECSGPSKRWRHPMSLVSEAAPWTRN